MESVNTNEYYILLPCPVCGGAWFYVSDNTYGADYENKGIRVNCRCHLAWDEVPYLKTREAAAKLWNHFVEEYKQEQKNKKKTNL